MKFLKSFLLSMTLTCLFTAAFSQQEKKFEINGTMRDMAFPEKVYLYGMINGQNFIDSCTVKNGSYHFTGKTNTQTILNLKAENKTGVHITPVIMLPVDEGRIDILSEGSFKKITLSGIGALPAIDYQLAMKRMYIVGDSIKNVAQKEIAAGRSYDVSQFFTYLIKIQQADLYSFLKANPQTPASPILAGLLYSSPGFPGTKLDSLISTLPALKQTEARQIINDLNNQVKIQNTAKIEKENEGLGKPAADFTLADVQGKPVSLSSFRGKYVLIDFWASWCGPCRAENPNVVKAFQTYKEKNFTIIGVSLDAEASKGAWISAIKKDGLIWTQVSDLKGWSSEVAKLYGVTAIPQNFLVDPNGVIVAKNLRGNDLNEKLASLFK